MIQYLEPEQAHAVINKLGLHIRDEGLLYSALARPSASMGGFDAYPSLEQKAAALMSSLAQNHALFDGNKRVSLILTFTFVHLNGFRVTFTNHEAFDLVIAVAQGQVTLAEIALRFKNRIEPLT